MSDPTDQRHGVFQALRPQEQRGQAPQQPQPPRPHLTMQRAQRLAPPPPPPPHAGFGGAALMPPMQGAVMPAHAAAAAAEAEDAARARAAERMAYEDAWKACNPDITTPFASVEDAVSRLLPYHVFADYEDEDDDVEGIGTNNLVDEDIEATQLKLVEEFEKQVTTFNVIIRQRAEGTDRAVERYVMENALLQQERVRSEHVRAAILQEQQQQQRAAAAREKEAARERLMLAQAQAVSAWPLVPPPANPAPWHHAPAAASRGEVIPSGAAAAGGVAVPQHAGMTEASAWQLQQLGVLPTFGEGGTGGQAAAVAALQRQRQQQQQQLAVWPTFVAPRGEGSSSGQAAAVAALQQLLAEAEAARIGACAAGGGMVQPRWDGAPRR